MIGYNSYDVVLVLGPESSGTRVYTEMISRHPDVLGTQEASSHTDHMDDVWYCVEKSNYKKAIRKFPKSNKKIILTRRSMPHAKKNKTNADAMDFPNVKGFVELCKKMNKSVVLLITTRSPAANLMSWKRNRSSAKNSYKIAFKQYQKTYLKLFSVVRKYDLEYFLINLESIPLDGNEYIKSLHKLLGLKPEATNVKEKLNVNSKWYCSFFKLNYVKDATHSIQHILKKIARKIT
jgi:hypothetical protein